MATLQEITRFLNDELRLGEIPDDPNAVNCLQLDSGRKDIQHIACAVDAQGRQGSGTGQRGQGPP